MTRQPAVDLRLILPVTGYAKVHLKLLPLQPVHRLHVSMALRTVETGPTYVGDVIKKDKVRHPEDTHPRDGRVRIVIGLLLLDFRMLRDYILVAEETFLHRGQARVSRALHVRMTETAVDLFHAGVDPVAERDGLLWTYLFLGIDVVKVEHDREEEPGEPQPCVPALWFDYFSFFVFSHNAFGISKS